MSDKNFKYDKITIGARFIDFDGVKLDGYKIAQGVTIDKGGPNIEGPTITITVHADEIHISDEAKEFAEKHGTHVTEVSGDVESICIRKYSDMTCTHVYRDGGTPEGACDD